MHWSVTFVKPDGSWPRSLCRSADRRAAADTLLSLFGCATEWSLWHRPVRNKRGLNRSWAVLRYGVCTIGTGHCPAGNGTCEGQGIGGNMLDGTVATTGRNRDTAGRSCETNPFWNWVRLCSSRFAHPQPGCAKRSQFGAKGLSGKELWNAGAGREGVLHSIYFGRGWGGRTIESVRELWHFCS